MVRSRPVAGSSAPPACRAKAMVIVPEMVPVCSDIWGTENTAVVVLAGIVKLAFLPPVENWIAASSAGTTASGWKDNVILPVMSSG